MLKFLQWFACGLMACTWAGIEGLYLLLNRHRGWTWSYRVLRVKTWGVSYLSADWACIAVYEWACVGSTLLMPFLKFSFIHSWIREKKTKLHVSEAFPLSSSSFRPLCPQRELLRREAIVQQHIAIYSKLSQKWSQLLYPDDRSKRV